MATSASVSTSHVPILLRPRNFQWYWNSASNPWLLEEEEQWTMYTDVENEIIEDACNQKRAEVEIDGNYIINFNQCIQYQKRDAHKKRPIKRVQLGRNRSNEHLREERFSLPIQISEVSSETSDNSSAGARVMADAGLFHSVYWHQKLCFKNKTLADVVEEAAQGILKTGISVAKTCEAHWLAEQLLAVKASGTNIIPEDLYESPIPSDIGKTCVYLYTKESFWYKLVNKTLRHPLTVTHEHVETLGPFCYLLQRYLEQINTSGIRTVYRGLNLTNEERQQFMAEYILFKSFTSTSINREKAEEFGNTLLIIDLNVKIFHLFKDSRHRVGACISHISDFPNEEEFLFSTGARFHFVKYEYDTSENKHIIYLKSDKRNS
jgi:hypothetical protein